MAGCASLRSPRVYSRRTSSNRPTSIICMKRRSSAQRRREAYASIREVERKGRGSAAAVRLQRRYPFPGGGVHFERTLDALRIVRVDARGGVRVDRGELRVQCRPTLLRGLRVEARTNGGITLGQFRDATC